MPIFDHFDFLAPFYEKAIPLKNQEKFIEKAQLPARGSLLDAGGGTGRVAKALIGLVDRVVLLDASPGMLREANQNGNLELVNGVSESLPFHDQSFDFVMMVDALHHVYSQKDTIAELWRATRPGGRIIIVEPDFDRFAVKLIAIAEKIAFMRSHFLSPLQIEGHFDIYPGAKTTIERDGFNAWIICQKPGESTDSGQHFA
jgi:demethylmenaquinone methyltransferase/2-methoxy-6-polyprenyl-1,4-benzoquinol methylase